MRVVAVLAGLGFLLATGPARPCEDLAEPALAAVSDLTDHQTPCEWNLSAAQRAALANQWHGNKEFLRLMDPLSATLAARFMQSVLSNYPPTFVQIYQVSENGRVFRYRILPYRGAPGDPGVVEFFAAIDRNVGFQKENRTGRLGRLGFTAGGEATPACFAEQVLAALEYESELTAEQREALSTLPVGARSLLTNWINAANRADDAANIVIEGAYPERSAPYIYYEVSSGDVEAINEIARTTIGLRVDSVDDRVWRITVPGGVAGRL